MVVFGQGRSTYPQLTSILIIGWNWRTVSDSPGDEDLILPTDSASSMTLLLRNNPLSLYRQQHDTCLYALRP